MPIDLVPFLKQKVALFADVPEDLLSNLAAIGKPVTFEPNEAIIEFGETGRFLGIMLDGEAEVSVVDDGGTRKKLAVLRSGDIFGEMSVMTGDRTVADIIGVSRCHALLFPEAPFASLLPTLPGVIKRLSKTIAERSKALAIDEQRGFSGEVSSALARSEDPYGFRLRTPEPMKILVVNSGSSSLKYNLYDTSDETAYARGQIERIGGKSPMLHTYRSSRGEISHELEPGSHEDALRAMLAEVTAAGHGLLSSPAEITAVGHRVVHGGEHFQSSVMIDDAVLARIEELASLAPLHNPVNALGIKAGRTVFPNAYHVAVFDTCFHHTLPPYAYLYGLPYEYYEKSRLRRYGFHGTSHLYVSLKAAEFLKRPFNELEIVSCHLGNGASLCAVDHGRSVDTSMGLTPAEGLIMGTRCGDVDPAVLLHLMRSEGLDVKSLDEIIQKKGGLLGISGISNDMREIEAASLKGDHRALLAFKTFCYRIRKYIGSYSAAMGGLDVVVFTGGIGQGSAGVRSLACQGLAHMGIELDEDRNRTASFSSVSEISTESSRVRVLVIATDEERMIARETIRTLDKQDISALIRQQRRSPIPVEISAHHVHLSQQHIEALFGPGHQLTPMSELSQPGQFACKEQVNLVGPKGRVERVRVLGPARKVTQVEVSMTEQFKLGIHPPIRESGDLEETPGLTLEGSVGSVQLDKGVICALRHVHMSPEDALRLGLRDKYVVRVQVEGDRELVFGDVLVRVHPNFRLAMHIDTDEGNAAHIVGGMVGHIDEIQSRGE